MSAHTLSIVLTISILFTTVLSILRLIWVVTHYKREGPIRLTTRRKVVLTIAIVLMLACFGAAIYLLCQS